MLAHAAGRLSRGAHELAGDESRGVAVLARAGLRLTHSASSAGSRISSAPRPHARGHTARTRNCVRRRDRPPPAAACRGGRRRRRRGARRAPVPARGRCARGAGAARRRGRRSWSSRRRCRFRARRTIRGQHAISAVVSELERHGISTGYQTILVAAGLARRPSQRALETFVTPELARRFHGQVLVHDVEDPELVRLDDSSRPPLRVNRALVETDLVIVVSAAESVLHGGPAALLAASAPMPSAREARIRSSRRPRRRAGISPSRSSGRSSVACRSLGVSLVLNHPETTGPLRGYPYDPDALQRIAGSPLRHVYGALPEMLRRDVLRSLRTELTVAAAFCGPRRSRMPRRCCGRCTCGERSSTSRSTRS